MLGFLVHVLAEYGNDGLLRYWYGFINRICAYQLSADLGEVFISGFSLCFFSSSFHGSVNLYLFTCINSN